MQIKSNGAESARINADGTTTAVSDFSQITSDVVPVSGDTYSLGTSACSWDEVFSSVIAFENQIVDPEPIIGHSLVWAVSGGLRYMDENGNKYAVNLTAL